MQRQTSPALRWLCALPSACAVVSGCGVGTRPGELIGSYSVHAVLVENSCGQTALPTTNPLDFVVEIREDDGVAYWIPSKSPQNTGTLSMKGGFRFSMSETQVVEGSGTVQDLQPSDFQTGRGDFDLQQAPVCALTLKQTVTGTLQRRLDHGNGAAEVSVDAAVATSGEDLSAEHLIEVTPASGSDCTQALAALGGSFLALPCEARYELSGALDTTGAVVGAAAAAGASASAAAGTGAAFRPAAN